MRFMSIHFCTLELTLQFIKGNHCVEKESSCLPSRHLRITPPPFHTHIHVYGKQPQVNKRDYMLGIAMLQFQILSNKFIYIEICFYDSWASKSSVHRQIRITFI